MSGYPYRSVAAIALRIDRRRATRYEYRLLDRWERLGRPDGWEGRFALALLAGALGQMFRGFGAQAQRIHDHIEQLHLQRVE